jgi:hypothetical protein
MVQVCSEHDILSTLAADGTLDGLPFMPEMRTYCGRTFEVFRRTEKICVEGGGIRRVKKAVFLRDIRCDGSCHGGCERRCLILWKEAWLKPLDSPPLCESSPPAAGISTEAELATKRNGKFCCQSTELRNASTPLPWWDLRQHLRDLALREVTVRQMLGQLRLLLSNKARRLLAKMTVQGMQPVQKTAGDAPLHLQVGELVEVKSLAEIEATLNASRQNRGLEFTPDMAPYCRRRYRVAGRVEKIVLEQTGEMRDISDTVVLDCLVCNGMHARGCGRANYYYWREAWLRRVEDSQNMVSAIAANGSATTVPAPT